MSSVRTFFVETWGCQMNRHDSEHLHGQLLDAGLKAAVSADTADLVLLNTCSVRDKPVQKILTRIGQLERRSPAPAIGICGCVAQQEAGALLGRSPAVRLVLGPGQITRMAEALAAVQAGQRPVLTGFDGYEDEARRTSFRHSSPRAMVTVIEGCDQYCTFCVVPYTRGREVSRSLRDVLDEVQRLAAAETREVELLGQTINAYRCPQTGSDFADLLDSVAQVRGLARVRYVTSHPRLFDDRLIDVLARHSNVSRYLHLPFQAGSNRILERMHRRYTREQYLELIDRIRAAVGNINLSTDVIVGFPGESDEDFLSTLDMLQQIRFGQVFAFAFSARPRTPARRYPGQVADAVKSERLQRLFELTDRIALELNQELVGTEVEVLIDGDSRRSHDDWQGRGEDNRVVNFPKSGSEKVGDLVLVRIERASAHSLYGSLVHAEESRLPLVD